MAAGTSVQIMGILNVTPDSFSDGGRFTNKEAIRRQVEEMLAAGVDIIDVGGESTRPFASPVDVQMELDRVIPAIEVIRAISDVPVSIDTTKADVAQAALAAGANMINDISALRMDANMVAVAREYDGPVIIMHMQGTPATMQLDPRYDDVVEEILAFFRERISWLEEQGVSRDRIIVDPGIGFGKTVEDNLIILRNVARFRKTGCPVLVGHSRKSFLGSLFDLDVHRRDCPTAMISMFLVQQGVTILRIHDVESSRWAVKLAGILS